MFFKLFLSFWWMRQDFHKQHVELTMNQIYFLLKKKNITLSLPMFRSWSSLWDPSGTNRIPFCYFGLGFFSSFFLAAGFFPFKHPMAVFLPSLKINKKLNKSFGDDLPGLFWKHIFEGFHVYPAIKGTVETKRRGAWGRNSKPWSSAVGWRSFLLVKVRLR